MLLVLNARMDYNLVEMDSTALVQLRNCDRNSSRISVDGPGCSQVIRGCRTCKATGDHATCTESMYGLQPSGDGSYCASRSKLLSQVIVYMFQQVVLNVQRSYLDVKRA